MPANRKKRRSLTRASSQRPRLKLSTTVNNLKAAAPPPQPPSLPHFSPTHPGSTQNPDQPVPPEQLDFPQRKQATAQAIVNTHSVHTYELVWILTENTKRIGRIHAPLPHPSKKSAATVAPDRCQRTEETHAGRLAGLLKKMFATPLS